MWKNYFFIRVQITLGLFLVIAGIIALFSFGIYGMIKQSLVEEALVRLKNIASIGSQTISSTDFEYLVRIANTTPDLQKTKEIYKTKEYLKIYDQLDFIKKLDTQVIKYVYTMTPSKDPNFAKFIVDGDYFTDLQESSESLTEFNTNYDLSTQSVLKNALETWQNLVEKDFSFDAPYGLNIISGYAPIYNSKHELLWVLGVDISDEWMQKYLDSSVNLITIFIIVSFMASFVIALSFSGYIAKLIGLREILKSLEESNKKLKDLDNKKTNFLNIASHELRTPLTSIGGYISMILDGDFGEINSTVKRHLSNVSGNITYLSELVSEMLDIARIDAGKEEVICEKFNLIFLLDEIYVNLHIIAKNKWVNLIKEIQIAWDGSIFSCKKSVTKILVNIIGNAIKFTPSEGNVVIEIKENNEDYLVKIQDSGIGIDRKDFEKIFEKFWQVGDSLNKDIKWTGLWLYIVKKNIANIGGTLHLDSELGKGAIFALSIPKTLKDHKG